MARPVTLFTGQWAGMPLEELCKKAAEFGYDGLELACWGNPDKHFDVQKALDDDTYCSRKRDLLEKYDLQLFSISNHLVGQAVLDRIDERHKEILSPEVLSRRSSPGDPRAVEGGGRRCGSPPHPPSGYTPQGSRTVQYLCRATEVPSTARGRQPSRTPGRGSWNLHGARKGKERKGSKQASKQANPTSMVL